MTFKENNLNTLIRKRINIIIRFDFFLHQMLQTLNYLIFNELVHRDVKSENILYFMNVYFTYFLKLVNFNFCKYAIKIYT